MPCPWPTHEDTKTSAVVQLDAGKWQCFDCGAAGRLATEPMTHRIGDRMQNTAGCAESEHLWGLGFAHDALVDTHLVPPFPTVDELGDMLWRCIRCASISPLDSDIRPEASPPFSVPLPNHRFPPQPPSGAALLESANGATKDDTAYPSLELYAMVFRLLRTADTHVTPLTDVMTEMVQSLTDAEASVLPTAIADVLPLLRRHTDKLRIAMDIAARLDLFELASTSAQIATTTEDSRIIMCAASLCANPGAENSARRLMQTTYADDPMVQIRLTPGYITTNATEERLQLRRWPGRRSREEQYHLPPAAVIDCRLPSSFALNLASLLVTNGFSVHRLPHAAPTPPWFGPETIFVSRSDLPPSILARLQSGIAGHIVVEDDNLNLGKVLREIKALSPELLARTPL